VQDALLVDADPNEDAGCNGAHGMAQRKSAGRRRRLISNGSCGRLRSGRLGLFDPWGWDVSRVNGPESKPLRALGFPGFSQSSASWFFGCLDQRERFLAGFTS